MSNNVSLQNINQDNMRPVKNKIVTLNDLINALGIYLIFEIQVGAIYK